MFNFIGAFTNVGINWLRCVFFKRSLFFGEWSICILHSIRTERDFLPFYVMTSKQRGLKGVVDVRSSFKVYTG